MDNNSYHNALREYVKATVAEQEGLAKEFSLSYKNDSRFQEFVAWVQFKSQDHFKTLIPERLLYALWFKARYFRQHWKKPTKRAEGSMVFTAARFGLSEKEICVICMAWWRFHDMDGDLTQARYDKWKATVLTEAMKEARPFIQAFIDKKREKAMAKLKNRIIETLTHDRSTVAKLAVDLKTTADAVQAQIGRLMKKGLVAKVGWGLYELSSGNPAIEPVAAVQKSA